MSHANPPPFLLVHGAYHGGWCWRDVARRLRASGFDVFTPTQTGLGERRHLLSAHLTMETFVQDIVNVILAEELEDVILVAHSYGSRVCNGVVDRMPERVRHLVHLDGGFAFDNQSRLEGMTPEMREARIAKAMQHDGGISVTGPSAAEFGIADPDLAAWVDRRMTPQPFGPERTALVLENPLGNGVPATYIACMAPQLAAVAKSAAYAKGRDDWTYVEIDAGHDAMVTHPAQVTDILENIVHNGARS